MDREHFNKELRDLRESLKRGEITYAFYQQAVSRLRTSAGSAWPNDPFDNAKGDSYTPRRATRLLDLLPDQEIGPGDNRFRLVREIGGGAMGRVWLAHDLEEEKLEGGERYKALKVVNPQLQDLSRALELLKREATRASQLTHPNIINVRGWRQGRDGWLFVVMDYLEGRDLDRLLLEEGKPGLSWERTLALLEPIAAGLDYAHGQGILHRDLKPGNVFITQKQEVKLLDFGLAYRLHRSSTMVGIQETDASGTPEYMPPEAFVAGEPDKARDIYALACLTYEMLTGKPPFSPEAARLRNPELLPGKPGGLTEAAWEVLKLGLAYRKEERPGSAGELVRRLVSAQESSSPEILKPELPLVQNIHSWPAEKVKSLQQQTAAALGMSVAFYDRLQDGSTGPEMVVIPAGEFLMGSPEDEKGRNNDECLHEVRIERSFAIGKYTVTFEEYDRFVKATGREKLSDSGGGRGRRPVINVSWYDAVAYAEWLSEQTEQLYRLPTEAEWEYAARAGTITAYHFGVTITTEQANFNRFAFFRTKTCVVGQFPPNAWGLYDVHGNVWEWTCSAYDEKYGGAELKCLSKNHADPRVLRGGAWYFSPHWLRAAFRTGGPPDNRNYDWGFRLARQF